ncbi:Gfo/Idh/MocA family protein [Prevotella sp. HUN102]|uniref:Gfo/Idh/MocA family protein n=1 Tax=Prevotella sp. HUN102 TaxID=1392486 RepID=UPI0004913C0A|nr:Gfo/Idh/MocA family oxidoreductase [Prevotella sp. HUN102]
MKEINWGFIGCGEVTDLKSGPAFNLVQGSHVEAVFSRSGEKAKSYASRHNIKRWYTDAQLLIDNPKVNAVYIATPPSVHATYAIMALRAGKPCYIEKPLAASYEDCVRINRVAEETGVPCFVAYYRRYLPYFEKVKEIVESGKIGKILTVQVRFAVPPRDLDYKQNEQLPWRLQSHISGGGYFYDLAPHQLDLLQNFFGVIVKAHGYTANRAGLYNVEDTVNAIFTFENGLNGSGAWCFASHESGREDRIEIFGKEGRVAFSVYNYAPIHLYTSAGRQDIVVPNPDHVQLPIIKSVIEDLQGFGKCECTSISATPTNWVMDRILGKI